MVRKGADGERELFFVMAQEDFSYRWNQSGCWSGFEGGTIDGEDDAATAAREFVEESLYSIPLFGSVDPGYIARRLREGAHCMKVYVKADHNSSVHTTYVVETPWNEQVVTEFFTVRRCLEKINNTAYRGSVGKGGTAAPAAAADAADAADAAHVSLGSVPLHLRDHPAVVAMFGAGSIHRPTFAAMMEKRRVQLCSYQNLYYHVYRADRKSCAKFRLRFRFVPLLKIVLERMPRLYPAVNLAVAPAGGHRLAEKVPECRDPRVAPIAYVAPAEEPGGTGAGTLVASGRGWDDPAAAAGGGAARKDPCYGGLDSGPAARAAAPGK